MLLKKKIKITTLTIDNKKNKIIINKKINLQKLMIVILFVTAIYKAVKVFRVN
jgi:hypothetical protein